MFTGIDKPHDLRFGRMKQAETSSANDVGVFAIDLFCFNNFMYVKLCFSSFFLRLMIISFGFAG